jgi:hypothetical protein
MPILSATRKRKISTRDKEKALLSLKNERSVDVSISILHYY